MIDTERCDTAVMIGRLCGYLSGMEDGVTFLFNGPSSKEEIPFPNSSGSFAVITMHGAVFVLYGPTGVYLLY